MHLKTSKWLQVCRYVDPGFVQWASNQVASYATIFRRQVYGVDQDAKLVKEAIDITLSSAQILNDVGLNLTFLLE